MRSRHQIGEDPYEDLGRYGYRNESRTAILSKPCEEEHGKQ